MTYTPDQISRIVLKVLKEIEVPDVCQLSLDEKVKLAQDHNTPVELLEILATDKDPNVRYWVARHPNTPVELLKILSTDKDSDVRYGVAEHSNTPVELLKVLATDKDSVVQDAAKENPNYKKQTLELNVEQYNALKKLIQSGQDESLKSLMDTF